MIGGIGTIEGPLVGALIFYLMQDYLAVVRHLVPDAARRHGDRGHADRPRRPLGDALRALRPSHFPDPPEAARQGLEASPSPVAHAGGLLLKTRHAPTRTADLERPPRPDVPDACRGWTSNVCSVSASPGPMPRASASSCRARSRRASSSSCRARWRSTQDSGLDRRETIVTHGPGQFLGELAQLSGPAVAGRCAWRSSRSRRSSSRSRAPARPDGAGGGARRAHHARADPAPGRACWRAASTGPIIIGHAGSADVLRLQGFLARNGQPHQRARCRQRFHAPRR